MGPPLPDGDNTEDPFVWESDGHFHALFHAMDPGDDQTYCGGHAFSEDGLSWTYSGIAFSNLVNFTDGSSFAFSRRERPHLLFAPDKTPIALSNGVQYGGPFGDAVFTLVQNIQH